MHTTTKCRNDSRVVMQMQGKGLNLRVLTCKKVENGTAAMMMPVLVESELYYLPISCASLS